MHRISTRSKSYTFSTTVRSSTCLLTIHNIRGNSQYRQGRFRILINRQFLQFLIEVVNQVYSQVVYTIIIITEAREFTFNIEAFCQADIITLSSNLRIFNSRKRIDSNRHTCYTISQVNSRIRVDKCHLSFFIIILIVHVMNDVHCLIIYTCHLLQNLLIVSQNFFEVQHVTSQHRNILHHQCTCILTTSTVDSQQQSLSQITTCTEELNMTAYILIRYAASNTIIIRITYFTHQVVVLVLNRRSVDRYTSTEIFKAFRQLRTPQNRQVWFWRRTEVIQGLQETERCLSYFCTAIVETATNRLCHPSRISGKDIRISLHTQVAYHTQFDNELVNQLLSM